MARVKFTEQWCWIKLEYCLTSYQQLTAVLEIKSLNFNSLHAVTRINGCGSISIINMQQNVNLELPQVILRDNKLINCKKN